MTTIAYDGRFIAIDSRVTSNGDYVVSDTREKFVDLDGWMIFWCGVASDIDMYVDAFLNNKTVDKDINVGLYAYDKKTKQVFEIGDVEGKIWRGLLIDMKACGSGSRHAITAMDCGRNSVEAVKLAMKRDIFTGGVIRCFDTHTGKFIKVKQ